MGTRTDDIGVWNDLGTVQAEKKLWVKFPTTATGANATLRASFLCSDWDKLSSYVLIRPRYTTASSDATGETAKIYPATIPVIIEMPIPADFQERSVYFRDFEVYKVSRRRTRLVGITPDANLQVRLEELWG
ncbi:hypothetical protein [Halotia branconii]|uniref:Uncharacterized protein n=1 Tax=Halotia branconii CENA392 TaxID=1539056 RepID=A0AAJ6NST9_9CYAN|nr:hypothetical protein [Halotia branconii]WGV25967.1 hypothetical protein QI031_00125 [Halotia branconii CENA392]